MKSSPMGADTAPAPAGGAAGCTGAGGAGAGAAALGAVLLRGTVDVAAGAAAAGAIEAGRILDAGAGAAGATGAGLGAAAARALAQLAKPGAATRGVSLRGAGLGGAAAALGGAGRAAAWAPPGDLCGCAADGSSGGRNSSGSMKCRSVCSGSLAGRAAEAGAGTGGAGASVGGSPLGGARAFSGSSMGRSTRSSGNGRGAASIRTHLSNASAARPRYGSHIGGAPFRVVTPVTLGRMRSRRRYCVTHCGGHSWVISPGRWGSGRAGERLRRQGYRALRHGFTRIAGATGPA